MSASCQSSAAELQAAPEGANQTNDMDVKELGGEGGDRALSCRDWREARAS